MSKKNFPYTTEVANRYGSQAVKQMKMRLKAGAKDGGELEKSIKYRVVYPEDKGVDVIFIMSKTADYVEAGRKAYGDDKSHDPPVVKNWSRSPLKKWMRRKGIKEKYKFGVARNIGKYGIEKFPFRFVTNTLFKQFTRQYERALAKDFELQLQREVDKLLR